ncbi:MAG: hypothetical protein IKA71_07575 [Lentisphaeria bacterium]|nr:hypothetical protein [Lentisphaeria bacterium]
MRKIKLLCAIFSGMIACSGTLAGTVYGWIFDSNADPAVVKSSVAPEFDGTVKYYPAKFHRETSETKGSFIRLDGASVEIPHHDALKATDDFSIETEFALDMKNMGKAKWAGLLSKGKNYQSGYALMLSADGRILFTLLTDKNLLWFQSQTGLIKDQTDHKVKITVNKGLVRMYLDGKAIGSRRCPGKIIDTGAPLHIGATYYPFYGKIYSVLIGSAAAVPAVKKPAVSEVKTSGAVFEWKCNDGTGADILSCTGIPEFNAVINNTAKMRWSQADERGFFPTFNGASAVVPHHENMIGKNGFILETEFALDMKTMGKAKWAGLLSKGKNYQSGFALMLNPEGGILFTLLTDKELVWFATKGGLTKNMRDHKLLIAAGNGWVKIFLDGKFIGKRRYYGKQIADKGDNFYIGAPYYPYFGNIYSVKIRPYDEKNVPPESAAAAKNTVTEKIFRPAPVVDPAGTVIVSDFSTFSPAPETGFSFDPRVWSYGKSFKTGPHGTLYPPQIDGGTISCMPGLTGKYDIYICGRIVSSAVKLQLRIGNDPLAYIISGREVPEFNAVHRNFETCVARDIEMKDTRITFYPGTFFYLGYIKFIPVANRRAKENPPDPNVTVTRGEIAKPGAGEIYLKFTRRFFAEKRPAPVVSEISRQRGFQIFSYPWMRLLFTNSNAAADTGTARLDISAAPGEYEPATLGVRGLQDNVGKLTLKLKKPFGNSGISADIAVVESIPKRTTSYHGNSEYIIGPQYLERTDTVAVKKGESRQFWVTFHVPENTPAGKYDGEFDLNGITVASTVNVRPFKLDAPDMKYSFCANEFSKESVTRDFEDMGRHGINWIYMHSDKAVKVDDPRLETMKVDMDNSMVTAAFNALSKYQKVSMISMYDDVFKNISRANPGRELEASRKFYQLVKSYGDKHNWPEIIWMGDDEILSHPRRLDAAIIRMRRHKSIGMKLGINHLWKKTVRPQADEAEILEGLSQTIILRYNTSNLYYVDTWDDILKQTAAEGKELYSYNNDCCIVFAQPAGKRFANGWFLRSFGKGSKGMEWYMYLGITGSPYTDLDGRQADWCYNYPESEGRKGGFAIDFEAMREGIDDMRYICTLENLIKKAKEQKIDTADAEKLLNTLADSFDKNLFKSKSIFINSVWEDSFEQNGKRYASGDYLPPNGWKLEDYDNAREKIAGAIILLQEKLK